jgi:hypothetical protein
VRNKGIEEGTDRREQLAQNQKNRINLEKICKICADGKISHLEHLATAELEEGGDLSAALLLGDVLAADGLPQPLGLNEELASLLLHLALLLPLLVLQSGLGSGSGPAVLSLALRLLMGGSSTILPSPLLSLCARHSNYQFRYLAREILMMDFSRYSNPSQACRRPQEKIEKPESSKFLSNETFAKSLFLSEKLRNAEIDFFYSFNSRNLRRGEEEDGDLGSSSIGSKWREERRTAIRRSRPPA